jgi:hypothetical protein
MVFLDGITALKVFLLFVGGMFAFVGAWGVVGTGAYIIAAANRRVRPLPQEFRMIVQLRTGVISIVVGAILIIGALTVL